ncbi:MAG: CcmD family protein [Myxococcota bacterium]|nr:CcmD family protein [Myxococcota bacterium]
MVQLERWLGAKPHCRNLWFFAGFVTIRRTCAVVAVALLLGTGGVAMAQDTEEAPVRYGTEFEAADLTKHKEDLSGIPFMVGAYMVIWSGLFAYLYSVRKRNGQVSAQLEELRAAIRSHDKGSDS